jgi:endoglucanase
LSNIDGPSGYEAGVGRFVGDQLEGVAAVEFDNLGSVLCRLDGPADGPSVMLAAHTDEVGFMVQRVTDKGFVHLTPLGGWWDQVLLGQPLRVLTSDGPVLGVLGAKPPHLVKSEDRSKIVALEKMFLDIGAKDKKQAEEEFCVRPGDPVVPATACTALADGDRLLGKAWDDRAGVAIMVEVIEKLAGEKLPNSLWGAGTAQEEVGLRGAQTSVQSISPDCALVLEVAICGDVPGIDDDESQVALGGGPTIYLKEGSALPNLRLRDLAIETARELEMPLQFSVLSRGGTDAGKIHLHSGGVPSLVMAVPARHIHAHHGIIDLNDYAQTVELVAALVRKLDAQTVKGLRPA